MDSRVFMLSGQVRVRGTKVLFRGQLEAWEAKQAGMWQGPVWQRRVIYEWGVISFFLFPFPASPTSRFPAAVSLGHQIADLPLELVTCVLK